MSRKLEIRNPKSETNPNVQIRKTSVLNISDSDFEIASDFEIRISDLPRL